MPHYYTFLDMHQNEVRNAVVQGLPSDPSSPVEGQIYYNTTDKVLKVYNGTDFEVLFGDSVNSISGQSPIVATDQGNGTWQISIPAASGSQNGYMSSQDKSKLDAATSANTANTLVLRDANGDFVARFVTVSTPTNANHAASKGYVDAVLQGFKSPSTVRVVAVTDRVRGGVTTPIIDGVNLQPGDRILLTGQTDPVENGVYVWSATTWSRATDWATGSNKAASLVIVQEGNTYADKFFLCLNNDGSDEVGTDGLQFTQFSGANDIVAGNGLTKSGNQLDVNPDNSTVEVSGDQVRVKDLGITAAKLNSDVAGAAMEKNGTSGKLDVKVDGATIEIDGQNRLKLVDGVGGGVKRFGTTANLSSTPTVVAHNLGNRAVSVRCFHGTSHDEIVPQISYVDANTISIVANPSVNAIIAVFG